MVLGVSPDIVLIFAASWAVIRNEDERDYVIGPYFVRSGETLRGGASGSYRDLWAFRVRPAFPSGHR